MKIDPNKMNTLKPAAYLTADKCQLYRSIMRTLYKEKEAYNSQLSAGSILKHLKDNDEFASLDIDEVKQALSQLTQWGDVVPMQDPREVTTIEEYKNKLYRYSPTEAAIVIERMTIELETQHSKVSTLSSALFVRINESLKKFKEHLESMNEKDMYEEWNNLQNGFQRLSNNFSDYLHAFYSVEGEKRLRSMDFLIHKDKFVNYLREFIMYLLKYSSIIEVSLKAVRENVLKIIIPSIVKYESELPRLNGTVNIEEITERIHNQWNGLYCWFISTDDRSSNSEILAEYTNEIIRGMINNAIILMQLQNNAVSKRRDYYKYLEMFGRCKNIDEAHCLSAHIFGAMSVSHYKYNTSRETDSIFEYARDLKPQVFEISPQTKTYKPRIKSSGFVNKEFDKAIKKQEYIAQIKRQQELLNSYIKKNKLIIKDLSNQIVPEEIRHIILGWISFANQNKQRTGITDFGRSFKMTGGTEKLVIEFSDGLLKMPDYTFEFEEK